MDSFSLAMPTLESLSLHHNQFYAPDRIHLLGCPELTYLDLSHNNLQTIPSCVFELTQLSKFKISNNKLVRLSPWICKLSKLTLLDVSANQIQFLAPTLGRMSSLDVFKFQGNPLEAIPKNSFCNDSDINILRYLQDRLTQTVPNRRVRLMAVGQANVGKSSILHYLHSNTPNPVNISTDGIQIQDWKLQTEKEGVIRTYDVSIWDFAGQDVYYTTHQMFLDRQAIYLLVWKITIPEEESRLRFG